MYKVTADGTFTTLHSCSALDGSGFNADGSSSSASLVEGTDGNFYGTTETGGATGGGTLFQITPAGALTSLHSFGARDGNGFNTDGATPIAGLVQGDDGSFYGTAGNAGTNGSGTIFKVTSAGAFTALYSFSATDGNLEDSDGAAPDDNLIEGFDGNFYGTTASGGTNGNGTVFQVTPGGSLTNKHSFTAVDSNGFNAARPAAAGRYSRQPMEAPSPPCMFFRPSRTLTAAFPWLVSFPAVTAIITARRRHMASMVPARFSS